jgi:hypothetical protein
MAKYKKKGQIDVYEKEKPSFGAAIGWIIGIGVMILICGGLANDSDGGTPADPVDQTQRSSE